MCLIYRLKNKLKEMVTIMSMLFAIRVVEGRTEFARVPNKLKVSVAEIICNDFELPELVPEEYRPTAE